MRLNALKYFTLGALMTSLIGGYALGDNQSFLGRLLHKEEKKEDTEPLLKQAPENKEQVSFSFSSVVNKAKPAVVSIYALQVRQRQMSHPLFDEQFFSFFFGQRGFGGIPRQEIERSLGSGVIVDPEGIIITCHHVVDDAKVIQVKLNDNRTFEAEVIVDDAKNDLAVIKIIHTEKDQLNLPFIPLGSTRDVDVGDFVIAIGNPFGVGMTVSHGIVSALARSFNQQVLLQTDTPINPGNSGGALVDMKGHLIAIPNAILSRTGASHGVGFAIPSAMLRPLLVAAKGNGKVIYPWDGIKLKPMTAEEAESFGLDKPTGILVVSIHPQSPAIKAGLKPGDIIKKINSDFLQTVEDYQVALQGIDIGASIELVILRQGQEESIKFNIIAPPASSDPGVKVLASHGPFSEVKVANLSPAIVQQYNFPDSYQAGVVVVEAPSNGFGFIGIQAGDIIEEINGKKVTDLKQLEQLMKEATYKIAVRRGDSVIVIQAQ